MGKKNSGSKCLNMAFIFKTSVGSINSSFSEENVSIVKKVTLPDGSEIPYVSGQAMRRYIRDKWEEMGLDISPVNRLGVEAVEEEEEGETSELEGGKKETEESKVKEERAVAGPVMASSKCNPVEYIDDDLFGFMSSRRKDIRKRTSPVKVSPAIAFFSFKDDRDFGVRITEEGKKNPSQMMPPFETEVYYNYFLCNILVDLERIGIFKDDNYGKVEKPRDLDANKRKKRLSNLIEAVRDLWGGGKQARFLTDISPKFVVYSRQTVKKPIFLERIKMKKDETIDVPSIEETLKDESNLLGKVIVGAMDGFGGVKVGQQILNNTITIENISKAFADILTDAESAVT